LHCWSCRYDHSICVYDIEKLDRPKEAFRRVRGAHMGAVTSLALDVVSNTLISGSTDGALRVWSQEGRCLDR